MYNQEMLLTMAKELCGKQKNPYNRESRLLLLTCLMPEARPGDIGAEYTKRYEEQETKPMPGNAVLSFLRKIKLNKVEERVEVCRAAWREGGGIAGDLREGRKAEWAAAVGRVPENPERERMVLLSAVSQSENLWDKRLISAVFDMGKFSARDFIQFLDEIQVSSGASTGSAGELEELQERIKQLHREVRRLKDSVREQAEEAAEEERESFFAQLNDEENGQILDLMMLAQKGFDRMRVKKEIIPVDIRSAQTLVRCMRKFLASYGVVPIMSLGETMEISCRDADELLYEGSPFCSDEDRKTVEVISTGWEIPERNIVISCPRVRELD